MLFTLDRPKPALPNSYFWTWDHSTNWMLDDPGLQNSGCYNAYLKHPDTFVQDYRRLVDFAAALGVKGIVIWGFLRDSHGGVDAAKRVAGYAASKNVSIMPGVGTTWYGGVYYEGDHPYSLRRFLREHPDMRMLDEYGHPRGENGEYGACPATPEYRQWLRESLSWLFREFEIGGVNLENGDLLTDYHPATQALRADWPPDDQEFFFFQGLSYRQALAALQDRLPHILGTYATYTGFNFGRDIRDQSDYSISSMGSKPPAMLSILPEESICQWTLSGMVFQRPLPLMAYLDDGAPQAAFDNPAWPAELKTVNKHSVGFLHQGSQWSHIGRYECAVSSIKEACLRAFRSGLEGVSIHGEVTSQHIPYALNYLAFSHFIHWPEDSLRDFGRVTLASVLGSAVDGEVYAEVLAHADAGEVTEADRKWLRERLGGYNTFNTDLQAFQRNRFYLWLQQRIDRNEVTGFF